MDRLYKPHGIDYISHMKYDRPNMIDPIGSPTLRIIMENNHMKKKRRIDYIKFSLPHGIKKKTWEEKELPQRNL